MQSARPVYFSALAAAALCMFAASGAGAHFNAGAKYSAISVRHLLQADVMLTARSAAKTNTRRTLTRSGGLIQYRHRANTGFTAGQAARRVWPWLVVS